VSKEQIKENVIALFKQKISIEKEIEKLRNKLVQQLCPKGKEECEPEYCVFRLANTCPFLKVWWKIQKDAGVPKDVGLEVLVDFIEKMLEDKGITSEDSV